MSLGGSGMLARVLFIIGMVLLAGEARAATAAVPDVNPQQCQLPAGCVDINTVLLPEINAALATTPPIVGTGTYADPRTYGATCGSGAGAATWNVDNATNDDAPGITAALATGLPVVIPYPGCKVVTQIVPLSHGAGLFSFAGPGPYDALTGSFPALTSPYLFVPTAAKTNATNNCIFDTRGLDGIYWRNITVIGVSMFNGTSAFCNSVGIALGRPQAFASLDNVSISNMAGIGTATDSSCLPTGTLSNPVFQMSIRNLKEGHNCFGIYANYSDTHISDWYAGNIYHACLAEGSGGGISIEIVNFRCEFTGHYDGGPLVADGAAFYLTGAFTHLTNGIFDHVYGPCIIWDGNNTETLGTNWSGSSSITCQASNARDYRALSATGSISGTTLTITAISTGVVFVGQTVTGAGVAANTTVTAVGTGTGGTGTYTVNNSQSVGSEALTGPGAAYPGNYAFINEASFISAVNMTSVYFDSLGPSNPPYNIVFAGTQARSIWFQTPAGAGPDSDGGWHTAFVNGTLPTTSHIEAAGWGIFDNRLPTSCSGLVTGMQALISNVLNSCP